MAILDTDLKRVCSVLQGEGKDSAYDSVKSQSTLQAPFTVVKRTLQLGWISLKARIRQADPSSSSFFSGTLSLFTFLREFRP